MEALPFVLADPAAGLVCAAREAALPLTLQPAPGGAPPGAVPFGALLELAIARQTDGEALPASGNELPLERLESESPTALPVAAVPVSAYPWPMMTPPATVPLASVAATADPAAAARELAPSGVPPAPTLGAPVADTAPNEARLAEAETVRDARIALETLAPDKALPRDGTDAASTALEAAEPVERGPRLSVGEAQHARQERSTAALDRLAVQSRSTPTEAAALPHGAAAEQKPFDRNGASNGPQRTELTAVPAPEEPEALEAQSTAALHRTPFSAALLAAAEHATALPLRAAMHSDAAPDGSAGAEVVTASASAVTPNAGLQSRIAPERPAVSATAADVDLAMPRWQEAFASRVQIMIDHDVGEARLKLNPPELGMVDVKIAVHDDKTFVQLAAASAAARDELAQSLPRLRELLTAGGLNLGGATVSDGGYGRQPHAADAPAAFAAVADIADVPTPSAARTDVRRSTGIDLYA